MKIIQTYFVESIDGSRMHRYGQYHITAVSPMLPEIEFYSSEQVPIGQAVIVTIESMPQDIAVMLPTEAP